MTDDLAGRPTLFCRRMMRNELDTWLSISNECTSSKRELAAAFMNLEDSIFFLASISGETIGGTSLFRDSRLLGLALTSVRLIEDYQESVTLQLLKSSLPFFKSVAIRNVDAIVSKNSSECEVPFPLSTEIGAWVVPTLRKLEFREEEEIFHYNIRLGKGKNDSESVLMKDKTVNTYGVRKLLWAARKTNSLYFSQAWLALSLAISRGSLRTYSSGEDAFLAFSLEPFEADIVVPLIVADFERIDLNDIARQLMSEVHKFTARSLHFPLTGVNQVELFELLAEYCNAELNSRELLLLRKEL
ncbi:MAG: hypothetical protein ACFE7R_09660 [Candidatus Hodarchaeota archaeon]